MLKPLKAYFLFLICTFLLICLLNQLYAQTLRTGSGEPTTLEPPTPTFMTAPMDCPGPTSATPSQDTICIGGFFSLTASGGGGTGCEFYWTYDSKGLCGNYIGWNNPVNWTPDSIRAYQIFVEARNSSVGSDTFLAFWVHVVPDPTIVIYEDTSVYILDSIVITSDLSGGTGACSIEWQVTTDSGSTWLPIPGETGSSIIVPAGTIAWYRAYRNCAGVGCNGVYSNIVAVGSIQFSLTVNTIAGTPTGAGLYGVGAVAYAGIAEGCTLEIGYSKYTFDHWSGDATGTDCHASDMIVMDTDRVAEANWLIEYYLKVETDYGTATGERWYNAGAAAFAGITGACTTLFSDTTRYVFTGWAGDASGLDCNVSNAIIMTGPKVAVASWQVQHYLTVNSAYATPNGEGWYAAGANAIAGINEGCPIIAGDSIRYVFTSWTGDASGTDCRYSDPILMNSHKTANANWQIQYKLQVLAAPGPHDSPTPDYGEYWYDAGTIINANVDSIADDDGWGTRYRCNGFTGTGSAPSGSNASTSFTLNAPSTLTWQWLAQYYLTMNTNFGTTSPDTGWYDAGTYLEIQAAAPIPGSPGERYTWEGWEGAGTGSYSGFDNIANIAMLSPITQTASWRHEYLLTLVTEYGFVLPDPSSWFQEGEVVTFGVIAPTPGEGERFVFLGWTGAGIISYTGLNNPASVTMNSAIAETANWSHQYYLTIYANHGTTNPAPGWFDAGTVLLIEVIPLIPSAGERFGWLGWTGHGTISYTGMDTSHNITMNSAIAETAAWSYELRFTVNSPHDSPEPPVGDHWYLYGTEIAAFVDSVVMLTADTRYRCEGWTGTGSVFPVGIADSFQFRITTPTVINWQWATQFLLTMNGDAGILLPGISWHNSLAVVPIRAIPPDTVSGERYIWNGWTGSGIGSYTGMDNPSVALMYDPIQEYASWIYQFRLRVASAYDAPEPAVGDHWYDAGTEVTAHVTTPVGEAGGTRYRCTGWTGSGSVPPAGADTLVTFNVDTVSTLTWNWVTQYFLTMTTDTGTVIPGDGWYDEGILVPIEAFPPGVIAGERYAWLGWTGTGTISYTGMDNPGAVTMNSPITQHAGWRHEFRLTVNSVHDTPNPPVGDHWFTPGSEITAFVHVYADTLGETRYRNIGWTGAGSVPATGDSNRVNFNILMPSDITWHWIPQYFFEILTDYSSPCPRYVDWYDSASIVTGCVQESIVIFGDTMRLLFDTWSTDATGDIYNSSDPILLDSPKDAQANWIRQFYCHIIKDPYQEFGTITLEGSTYPDIGELFFWGTEGSTPNIGVSDIDYSADSIYFFTHWSDGGPLFHNTAPILTPAEFTAFYTSMELMLSICLNKNEWDLDTMEQGDTRTMTVAELIRLTNCGNFEMDLGLHISGAGAYWAPGYMPDADTFTLRAEFTNSESSPVIFHPSDDLVGSILAWATETIYGPLGFDLSIGAGFNLWMQFLAPTTSSILNEEQTIILVITAQVSLP